jgi:hypothetical protein
VYQALDSGSAATGVSPSMYLLLVKGLQKVSVSSECFELEIVDLVFVSGEMKCSCSCSQTDLAGSVAQFIYIV